MSIMVKLGLFSTLVLILMLVFSIGPYRAGTEPIQQNEPPKLHKLEFRGPEEGWPPKPKGMTNIKAVVSKEIPGALTDEMEERIRRAALQNANVRQLLGSRFAYIGVDEIEPDKKRRNATDPLQTRALFFNYANSTAVEVLMKGLEVKSVEPQKEVQVPEGAEEVIEAEKLAQKDTRLIGKLTGLTEVNGILVEVPQGTPGFGNRVIEVFFGRKNEDLPDYHALVDLTERKVITAGPLRRQ